MFKFSFRPQISELAGDSGHTEFESTMLTKSELMELSLSEPSVPFVQRVRIHRDDIEALERALVQ